MQDNCGIIIKAKENISVSLFYGNEQLEETKQTAENGLVSHCFFNLKENDKTYWYEYSCEGYYTVRKDINYKENQLNIITVNADKRKGDGFEPTVVNALTDEFVSSYLTVNPKWKLKYPIVYTTPTLFSKNKAAHEFTSNKEAEEYLSSLKGSYRRYTVLKTAGGNNLSLFVFTKSDLSRADTLDSAASVINKNGKITLMYMAQIHGNEPAGGDCALAVINALCGEFGKKITENMNIIVIPRSNPDGAEKFTRYNVSSKTDMNRDYIKMTANEVQAVVKIHNLFMPFAVIDGHEYFKDLHLKKGAFADVLLGTGSGLNNTADITKCSTEITGKVISQLNGEGFCATYYPASENAGTVKNSYMVNTANFSTGRGFFALKGSISILVESYGMNYGKQGYERRVVSQYITVTSLINAIAENPETVRKAVEKERKTLIEDNSRFDINRKFTLSSGSELKNYVEVYNPEYNLLSGEVLQKCRKSKCFFYDKAERSRPNATAFAVSKNIANTEKMLNLINRHGIKYREIAAEDTLLLRQYGGDMTKNEKTGFYSLPQATLSEEKAVVFKDGGYLFPCNQLSGLLIMYLFEPDVNDTEYFGSGLCQSGILTPCDIYRSEQDLSEI